MADRLGIADDAGPVDDHLVLHAVGLRQAGAEVGIYTRHARRGAEDDAGGRAARDVRGLVVRPFGDALPGLGLEIVKLHEVLSSFGHCSGHFRRHDRSAEDGHSREAVDDLA